MEAILKMFDLKLADAFMIPVCSILFIILWRILEDSLFKPFLSVVESREKATVDADVRTAELLEHASKLETEYEESLLKTRIEAMQEKNGRLDATRTRVQKLVDEAKAASDNDFRAARSEIAAGRDQLRGRIMGEVDQLADQIANRILFQR